MKRRLEKGQWFRTPCLGCSEFPVKRIELVDAFDTEMIKQQNQGNGDVDLGYMSYEVQFEDRGENPLMETGKIPNSPIVQKHYTTDRT